MLALLTLLVLIAALVLLLLAVAAWLSAVGLLIALGTSVLLLLILGLLGLLLLLLGHDASLAVAKLICWWHTGWPVHLVDTASNVPTAQV